MKPPITYYGGKQRMVSKILPLIPRHKIYTEAFLGGGAIFWAKDPSPHEVINDLDDNVINFYRVLKTNFDALFTEVHSTLHSRSLHTQAKYILKRESEPEESYTYTIDADNLYAAPDHSVQRAWAFWVQTNMSFSAKMFGGFAYDRSEDGKTTKSITAKRERFQQYFQERMKNVCIECNDALKVIQSRDTEYSFHYCDPPYFNSNMGHYGGYTEDDFEGLLQTLENVKGTFLLSSYPSEVLEKYVRKNGWGQITKDSAVAVSHEVRKKKTEVLTYNYVI